MSSAGFYHELKPFRGFVEGVIYDEHYSPIPDDWLIGYSQGTATLGYLLPLIRSEPTPILGFSVNGSWATFFYFKTQRAEGETLDAPPLNWDVFWGTSVFFVLPL